VDFLKMNTCNIYYINITIQPVFIKKESETVKPFEGVFPEDEGLIEDIESVEYVDDISHYEVDLIQDVLHHYFGPIGLINYEENITKGILELATVSKEQMETLKSINIYTGDYPVSFGPSHLKFKILNFKENCDCYSCYQEDHQYDDYDDLQAWRSSSDSF